MRGATVLFLLICFLPMSLIISGHTTPLDEAPKRSVEFVDIAPDIFDDLGRVNFISAGDWNGDGYVDLLFNGNRLFKNTGPPEWDYQLQGSVFGSSVTGAVNGVWADWDGDGDLDLYQGCRSGTADRFWENQGYPDHNLTDRSVDVFGNYENLGPNTGSAWADFDGDGDLDIYVGSGEDWNDGDPIYYKDFLLRNDDGEGFTDITSTVLGSGENLYTRGATFGDFNNDHLQDIYVSHYRIRENHLFENDGMGGMNEVADEKNCSGTHDETWYYDSTAGSVYGKYWWGPTYGHTIGSSWADFNRDGNLDLWTSDFVHKYVGYIGDWYDIRGYVCDDANLYISDGAPHYTFTDYRNTSGIPRWPIGGQGTYRGDQTFSGITIGDFDNDGWEDMYIPQVYGDLPYTTPHLYHNRGIVADGSVPNGTRFEDVTDALGIDGANTYACLFLDHDNDGDLDLLTGGADTWDGSNWQNYRVRLYQNQGTDDNHYLRFQLNGTGMNPQAIGARVVLRIEDELLMIKEVRAGTGHAHQGSNILHFGLGNRDLSIRSIIAEVHWPDGLIHPISVSGTDRTIYVDRWEGAGPESLSWSYDPQPPRLEEDEEITITVEFSSSDSFITKYLWDIDMDGSFDLSTDENKLKLVYHEDGLKHIRCRAVEFNLLGKEIYPMVIEVPNNPPVIDIDDIVVDMDETLQLDSDIMGDTPSDLKNISWKVDWGDGELQKGSGSLSVMHEYSEPGILDLTIEADDGTDLTTKTVKVDVRNVAPWGWLEIKGDNSSVQFEDHRIRFFPHVFDTPSDESDFQLYWDFGDGTVVGPTSVSDIVHGYADNGIYTVNLEVRDDHGGRGELTRNITIMNLKPTLVLSDPMYSTMVVEEDTILEFDDILIPVDSRSDEDDLEFKWEFGDASRTEWISTPDVDHTYDRSGSYQATCFVRDDDGDIGNHSVTVIVENPVPVMGAVSQFAEVWEDQEFQISFNAEDNPSDEESLNFFVDLGDGRLFQAASGVQVSYPISGDYEITVTVVDDDGATDTYSSWITVKNRPPDGKISASAISVNEDEQISFKVSSIEDSYADIGNITASWNMKDGSSEINGLNATHVFTDSGRYEVELFLFDGDDGTRITITVTVNNPLPVAVFSMKAIEHIAGETLHFDASNSSDNPSDIPYLSFYWDFGDGNTATGMWVDHIYKMEGTYTVQLEVVDDDGSSSYSQIDIEIGKGETDNSVTGDNGLGTSMMLVIVVLIVVITIGIAILVPVVLWKRSDRGPLSTISDDSALVDGELLRKDERTPEQIYNRGLTQDQIVHPPGKDP